MQSAPSQQRPRGVVYTAIIGECDTLFEPAIVNPHWQYVCFSDRSFPRARGWDVRRVEPGDLTPRRRARRLKLLSHETFPEADYALWVDASLRLLADPARLVANHLATADVAAFRHRWRDCIYAEANACARLGKDEPDVLRRQTDRYRALGYPERRGLVELNLLLRRHSEAVCRFNERWWSELVQGSVRDQVSFNVTAWREGVDYAIFPGACSASEYVHFVGHIGEPGRRGRQLRGAALTALLRLHYRLTAAPAAPRWHRALVAAAQARADRAGAAVERRATASPG